MRRFKANKPASARQFNRKASRTKRINVAPPPTRGGYKL